MRKSDIEIIGQSNKENRIANNPVFEIDGVTGCLVVVGFLIKLAA